MTSLVKERHPRKNDWVYHPRKNDWGKTSEEELGRRSGGEVRQLTTKGRNGNNNNDDNKQQPPIKTQRAIHKNNTRRVVLFRPERWMKDRARARADTTFSPPR